EPDPPHRHLRVGLALSVRHAAAHAQLPLPGLRVLFQAPRRVGARLPGREPHVRPDRFRDPQHETGERRDVLRDPEPEQHEDSVVRSRHDQQPLEPLAGRDGESNDPGQRGPEWNRAAHRGVRRTHAGHGSAERSERLDRRSDSGEILLMRRTESHQALLALLAFLLALVAGCGLFKPRDPRSGGGPGVNCATPNSPDNVVANILAHYAELAGTTCYSDMLDASFAFHPDATDSNEI